MRSQCDPPPPLYQSLLMHTFLQSCGFLIPVFVDCRSLVDCYQVASAEIKGKSASCTFSLTTFTQVCVCLCSSLVACVYMYCILEVIYHIAGNFGENLIR